MNTRYVVLVFLSFILFANLSCDEDDFFNDEEEDIVLTNENNLYEGDLFRLYLTDTIASTNAEIVATNELLLQDPNNDSLATRIVALNEIKLGLQGEAETQDQSSAALGIVPRVPIPRPNPPNPCTSGACIPNILEHLTISQDIASLLIQFQNLDTEEVIETININEFTPFPEGFNNMISVTGLNLSNYSGALKISVTRTNTNNVVRSYSTTSFHAFQQ